MSEENKKEVNAKLQASNQRANELNDPANFWNAHSVLL